MQQRFEKAPWDKNILTLDIEDWCQSSADVFGLDAASTPIPTERVVANTRRLLGILAQYNTKATCFVLGSIADAFPDLVREIHESGHEVASHGYFHRPLYRMDRDAIKLDVSRSLESLARATGTQVKGYRAPYFSMTKGVRWALPILAELGLEYDASTFPLCRRYYWCPGWRGAEDADRFPHTLSFGSRKLVEIPATTIRLIGNNLPVAGGAFFRFLPSSAIHWSVRRINRSGHPAVFYLHPHDLDIHELRQPVTGETFRMASIRWALRIGRGGNEAKLRKLLAKFSFTSIRTYLDNNGIGDL